MNRTTNLKLFPFSHRLAAHSLPFALSLLLFPLGTLAMAADQSVTTIAASGPGSLPQAVADVGDGEDVIFQPAVAGQTITLSSNLDVNRSMNFTNNTGGGVTVDLGINWMPIADGSTISLASGVTLQASTVASSGSFTINQLSGTITSNSGQCLAAKNINITGGLSGKITATGDDYAFGIIGSQGICISGGLSGTIMTIVDNGSAMGMMTNGLINGGDANTPLVITGSVIGKEVSGEASGYAIRCCGMNIGPCGINLKLEESGLLSAGYAISSNGPGTDRIELVAGCTVIGDIDLGDGTSDVLTLSGTNGTTTYDGDIFGVEMLNVTGGNWHLNGQIGCDLNISGGALGGTAQIGNLTVDGTVAPGNSIGTLNVGGNYTQNVGSTLEIEVNDAGQSDLVDVGGTATIHGGTIEVQAESGTYTLGQTYTVLDADGGVNGTFDALFDNLADYNFRLVYNANSVQLVLTDDSYAALAQTSNQLSVANYLNDYVGSATGDFHSVMGRINALSASEARAAFDSLSGELYGSLSTVGIENTDRFLRTIASRLRARSLAGMFTYGISDTLESSSSDVTVARGQDACAIKRSNRWLPWAEGYGVGAKIANDGNASGLEYSVGGMTYGFESELDEHTLLGFMAGYSKTFVNLDALENHGEVKSAQAGLYLNHHSDAGYATGIAAYGYNAYDTWRRIQIGSLARLARAAYEGNEFSFYFETGRNFQCRAVYMQPFAALQYIQLHQNGFDESGADSVNLSVDGIGADSFRGLLGTRLVGCFQTNTGQTCTIEGRALWRHEFLDEARVVDAQFAGQPGGSFAINGINVDRDAAILGGGLTYCLTKNAKLYGNYDLLFSQNYAAHASSAGLMLAW